MKTFNLWLKEMYHPPEANQTTVQQQVVHHAEKDLLNSNNLNNLFDKLAKASKQVDICFQYMQSAEKRNLVFNKKKFESINNTLKDIKSKIRAVQMYEKQVLSALTIGDDGDKQIISSNNMDVQKILDAEETFIKINQEMLEILTHSKYSEIDDLLAKNYLKIKEIEQILDNFQLRLGLEHPEDSEELLKNLQSRMKSLFR